MQVKHIKTVKEIDGLNTIYYTISKAGSDYFANMISINPKNANLCEKITLSEKTVKTKMKLDDVEFIKFIADTIIRFQ